MSGAVQLRVRLRLDRMAFLQGIERTYEQDRELARLRHLENVRRANRAWRARGNNASRCVALTRQWKQANPGCVR